MPRELCRLWNAGRRVTLPLLRIWIAAFFLVVVVVDSDTVVVVAATLPYCAPNQQPELGEWYFEPPDSELMPPLPDDIDSWFWDRDYTPHSLMDSRRRTELAAFVGGDLGTPLECVHHAGAVQVQRTTKGMLVARRDGDLIIFSNGQRNWAISGVTDYEILDNLVNNPSWSKPEPFTWEGSPASPPGFATQAVGPDRPFVPPQRLSVDPRLVPAWKLLGKVGPGYDLLKTGHYSAVNVRVEALPQDSHARYVPATSTLTLAPHMLNESPEVQAAALAHELMHVKQIANDETDCLSMEVGAHVRQAQVWRAIWEVPPENTQMERILNRLAQVYDDRGEDGIRQFVLKNPGYQEQCQLG